MKNYLVKVLINFDDTQEQDENGKNKKRVPDETFYCTKERFEFLREHNAVMLLEIKKLNEENVVPLDKENIEKVAKAILNNVEPKKETKKKSKK